MSESAERRALLAILAVAFALRLGFAWTLPPFQAPDERAHLEYVRTLVIDRGLPVQPRLEPRDALRSWPQSYQPPLAYLAFVPAAAVSHALDAGPVAMLRTLRVQNALYGTLLVAVVFAIATRLRPSPDPLRLLAPLLAATLPGLASNAGSLNNDALAILLASIAWCTWHWMPPGVRRGLCVGGVLGAACLAKLTAATLAPLCLLVPWLEHGRPRHALLEATAAGVVVLFLLFPWLVRNLALYGDPLAVGVGSMSFASLRAAGVPDAFLAEAVRPAPGKALLQFFGRFGITNNLSWSGIAVAWLPLCAAAALGWGLRDRSQRLPRSFVAGACAALVLAAIGLVTFSLQYYGAWQGRYLYVAIAPISLLTAQGLSVAGSRVGGGALLWLALAGLLTAVAGVVLYELSAFFAETPRPEWGLRGSL